MIENEDWCSTAVQVSRDRKVRGEEGKYRKGCNNQEKMRAGSTRGSSW